MSIRKDMHLSIWSQTLSMLLLKKPLVLESVLLCRPKGRDWARSGAHMLEAPTELLRLPPPSAPWNC